MRSELLFVAVFLSILISVPVLNFAIDPLALYRDKDSFPFKTFEHHVSRGLQFEQILARASRTESETVLLGTSHVGVGFNTCDLDVERLWLSDMSWAETERILQTVTANVLTERLVILDLAALGGERNMKKKELRLQDTLYSYELARLSVLRLLNVGEGSVKSCEAFIPHANARGIFDVPESFHRAFSSNPEMIEASITALAETCRNPAVTVAVVFFPFHFSLDALTIAGGLSGLLDGRETLSVQIPEGGCKFEIVNLAGTIYQEQRAAGLLGKSREGWFDFNHFLPVLGRLYLDRVLSELESIGQEGL